MYLPLRQYLECATMTFVFQMCFFKSSAILIQKDELFTSRSLLPTSILVKSLKYGLFPYIITNAFNL